MEVRGILEVMWQEWRCPQCGALILKHDALEGGYIQIKCWKCKTLLHLEATRASRRVEDLPNFEPLDPDAPRR